jgi:hypothetical protein
MIVTIHQPEHFPYEGFFQKLERADVFVVLDNVKFRKNYFQNRNKILTRSGTEDWVTVPVEKSADSKDIKDVEVSRDPTWRKKVVRKIKENLKFDSSEIYQHDKLIDINMSSIRWCMQNMKVERDIVFASSLGVTGGKSELLSNIVRSLGATKYISGPSGRDYLDMSYFEGIEVEFFEPKVNNYYSSLYNIATSKFV